MENLYQLRRRIYTTKGFVNESLNYFYSIKEISFKNPSPFLYQGKEPKDFSKKLLLREPIFLSDINGGFPEVRKEEGDASSFITNFPLDREKRYQIKNFSLLMVADSIMVDQSLNFWVRFLVSNGSILFPIGAPGLLLSDLQIIE